MEKQSIFESKEQYLTFVNKWKEVANSESKTGLTLQHFILYSVLRGKDYKKCLSPSSKDETICDANDWALHSKYEYLSLWPFGNLITREMLELARKHYMEKQ